ncbi:hypothetical protein GCM10009662_78240 [Catellatospora coxensis]|uniref:Uncharacterized protein n=1 Tax=Catellatospora coxensis TaxID=310354 RepID=A0A8J3L1L0_9ACTN|nr:hypothetical protein Cco03nite_70270 [Catellatospora coxensis]
MRRSSRAAAVTGAAVVLPARGCGTAGEKSLSQPAHPASLVPEQGVRYIRTVPAHDGRGPAPLTTDRPRSRSCAALGKDCQ